MRRTGKINFLIAALFVATALLGGEVTWSGDNATPPYHYEDIDRFFESYDSFLETGDEAAFESYLKNGSVGLSEFQDQFALTPEFLAKRVRDYPKFFASLRTLKSDIQANEAVLDAMFEELTALFPDYEMPAVYFLVGGLRAGGQAGEGNYVMVGAEVYTKGSDADLSEMAPGRRMYTPQHIVNIVAHEAAHVIQEEIQGTERYISIYTEPENGTLLAYSLREGAANLVAKLTSGGHINPEAEEYGLKHEAELWQTFREQALDTELGDWFFYAPKENPDWPKDLGYWMGYRMALQCYESAADKSAMLNRVLDARDPEALLQECSLQRSGSS